MRPSSLQHWRIAALPAVLAIYPAMVYVRFCGETCSVPGYYVSLNKFHCSERLIGIDFQKGGNFRFNSERGVRGGRESDLVWRRANNPNSSDKKQPLTSSSSSSESSSAAASSKRGSCFFPNKGGPTNWSAINSELKSKQKIAKVRPTLQARIPPSMMTVDAVSAKNSEYAQLSEFTSLDVPKSGLSDAIQEEDSDSDRTPAGSTRMHESEDELDDDMWASMTASSRRILPSDRVTCKAWENDDISISCCSNYGTIDSHQDGSYTGTMRKAERRAHTPPHSMHSLPRAVSRYSHQIGSLDDLPLSLPALSPNLNSGRKTSQAESSAAIQSYVERLAEDESTVFGATLRRFIECTVQSEEADPSVVVRNVRQFINGIKNYLVKHGEG
ncbi:hypothetical protein TELCIR_10552 [Teladorsagia circumcincta]|uniref:Uncharacterized protein n=1 Tax=Teladorsagia circumcincta TaxID=45464 RepID=A0A2G9UBT0_TELCI|nr:hypothetical protein TELCIR_10552 [Teladorsagia circumcincta]